VQTDPPGLVDFLSDLERGRGRPDLPLALHRLLSGRSVYATESQARRKARVSPALGRYVAILEIPHDTTLEIERTTSSAGHHTIWGDAALLLSYVVAIVPVRRPT